MNKSKFFILILILTHTSELMSQKIDLDILQGKTTRHLVGDTILLEKETFKAFEKMDSKKLNLWSFLKISFNLFKIGRKSSDLSFPTSILSSFSTFKVLLKRWSSLISLKS